VITTADAITASAIALAGATTAIAAALRAGHEHHAEPAPPPRPAIAAPAAYEPCHTTTCGHMSTPHDHTAAGLTCRGCGTTKEAL
jgi:hypothetical protein